MTAGKHLIHALLDRVKRHEAARLALQVADDRSQRLELGGAVAVRTVVTNGVVYIKCRKIS